MLLDGDQLRHGLCGDLGFSPADRSENIRRAGEVARLFFEQGNIVLCSFVSPFQRDRDQIKQRIGPENFLEIFVDCPLEICRQRDTKGLYARAGQGSLQHLTGMHQPYEAPLHPDFIAATQQITVAALVAEVLNLLQSRQWISK